MTEIRFYHLQRQHQNDVMPSILSKALERGFRVVVKMPNEMELKKINDYLWTFRPDSFLAHGSAKEGNPERQPVWLTCEDDIPNKANLLIIAQGTAPPPTLPEGIELCCEMIDGNSPESVKNAREHWKSYKSSGYEVTYWQQDERGAWNKKA